MTRSKMQIGPVVVAAIILAACPAPEDPPPPETGIAPDPVAEPAEERPDTTAESVWSHLQTADYRQWRLWPATSPMYEGTEPHGVLLTTYLNDRAYGSLTGGEGPLPAGSMIVKESFGQDTTLRDITVMYVVEAYDPMNDDYFWAQYDPAGTAQTAGRVQMCQECHTAAERSFLMTPHDRLPEEDPWGQDDP